MSTLNGFKNPSPEHRSMPKWIWNAPLDRMSGPALREQLKQFRDHDGYAGVMIVPWFMEGYLTEKYFKLYGQALDIAADVGLTIILWDDNGFPTGPAGGWLEQSFPECTARRLDLTVLERSGPVTVEEPIPPGTLMGVVAVNSAAGSREDITSAVDDQGRLQYRLPAGRWKIMLFTCVREEPSASFRRNHRMVDYLDAGAVEKFIGLTHQQYYDRFPHHFGTTIQYAFYDEPSFWHVQGGRIWTPDFNRKFRESCGYDPVIHYPALWCDVGPETPAARNALFGFRARLYAEGFVKTLSDWCRRHRIRLTGHMDQEEIANPASLHGDLMKVFEHQEMPGVDEIGAYGRGSRAYKIVSSAAFNYDKPQVMCEAYGGMGEEMPVDILYREAMDLYAKGVSFMVPHGTWYDNVNDVTFPPELSFRSAKFGPALPEYNRYIARLTGLLAGGRHVADLAVLYPIAALQAGYRFGSGDAYRGGVIAPEANYLEVGEMLCLQVRRDFTFVHPQVLDARCSVAGALIRLDNAGNREQYQVFILTGGRVVQYSNIQKLERFFRQGGRLIAAGQLPCQSAEFGQDREVVAAVKRIFGVEPQNPDTGAKPFHVNTSRAGGRAYYLPDASPELLRQALADCRYAPDVEFEEPVPVAGGNLSYIHKVKDGRHWYFVANSSDTPVNTTVKLNGLLKEPELWDPHTGHKSPAEYQPVTLPDRSVTRIKVQLPPVKSLFITAAE